MRFSFKLLLWTVILLAMALGFSGFYLVNYVFETSLNREIGQALDENSILGFALETAALNVPAKYDVLQDNTVEEIASNLERGGQSGSRLLRISDEAKKILYVSEGFPSDEALLQRITAGTKTYRVILQEETYYVQTGVSIDFLDRILYLETMKEVTEVFQERMMGFSLYRKVTVFILAVGTGIMYFIASWLTKPIRLLTRATKRMAEGEYSYRAKKLSSDELGQLTVDFNDMAAVLEENIGRLEEEIEAREEFMAAFAHELKTPLTAIIGYADILRSHRLDGEKSLMCANYIYTEGKRLETMSFRLLDIMVAGHKKVQLRQLPAEAFFSYLENVFSKQSEIKFTIQYENGIVWAEESLIKTVLVNLVDNACKASEPGNRIELIGERQKDGYRFVVRDYGIGISEEEQKKIIKPFYMVDKSRSRSRNGAGLGLALCTGILELHQTKLEIESVPGEGSCFGFFLPDLEKEERDEE
ncbi:MAG: HAMP domain-containing histidine kinase [Lachnospiraceae bacterium]|nr:HAMP domain-containing histidine kinase [Lachnospiraceae bacterium]